MRPREAALLSQVLKGRRCHAFWVARLQGHVSGGGGARTCSVEGAYGAN